MLIATATVLVVGSLIWIYSPGDIVRDGHPDTGTVLFVHPNLLTVLKRIAAAVSLIMSLPILVLIVSKALAGPQHHEANSGRQLWFFWLLAMACWLFLGEWYPLSD
ncbi:hypothetical protein LGH70_08275 [Hymenobacter sp. BT635]|uniref:Uncharacterized protein n=1 Tax=Hymenobacter nitidus TaxID=2880929 RepID=A0ABS8AB08_9BACT|nr:hypothetical protein [Hymenobacter nitidus]